MQAMTNRNTAGHEPVESPPARRREARARGRAPVAILILVASLVPRPASAEWPELGRAVSTAPADQIRPQIASDGAAGAIIVWEDFRSARVSLFARRVLASGEPDPAWPADGLALLADSTALPTGGQQSPVIISDGTGGAIVAWQDARSPENLDIFAQHVLGSGVVDPAWPANGRALTTAAGQQDFPAIVTDGAGGAIVTWMDARPGASVVDVYARHVLASGIVDPNWTTDGILVSGAPEAQAFPKIASDGAGGAIVTWLDFRSSSGASGVDLYAQRVRSTGMVDPAWPVDGRALSLAAGSQENPAIVADGEHGAIVAWGDGREGPSHIFAQRVLGSGAIAAGWPEDGLAVCTAAVDQEEPDIASDGAAGAIITWRDARSGHHNPYVQHVLGSGAIDPAWPDQGRALTLSTGEQLVGSIVEDGAGGAIVAWEEDFFVFAHHVEASGVLDPTFPESGRFLRLTLTFQRLPELVSAGPATAIVAWFDRESSRDSDIYAQLVVTDGTLVVDPGTPGPEITFARPSPNPARLPLTLRFSLPRATRVRLVVYDAAGRRVRELASGDLPAGEHVIAWDLRDERGRAVGAGLHFARLEAEGRALTHKLATLQ